MKRSFRVATVFTGIAACATALAPPAEAAPAIPGATTTATAGTPTVKKCTAGLGHWVHLYYTLSERHGPECFGGSGYIDFTGKTRFFKLCAGNNYGYVMLYSYSLPVTFGPPGIGKTDSLSLFSSIVSQIYISGHLDSYTRTCPL